MTFGVISNSGGNTTTTTATTTTTTTNNRAHSRVSMIRRGKPSGLVTIAPLYRILPL
jgi:hypothetical protein